MTESKLVIVESPTKARTIRKFLGPEYRVEASMGHIRDLPASADEIPEDIKGEPWARLGVDVDAGFAPVYVIPSGKKKIVAELRKALKNSQQLYLATDEDREGEAIGWHLVEVLGPKVPIHRMVFHEITKEAIKAALASPRQLNHHLVQAQETRRVLDRLVGYTVSPLLWKKVAPKLSAGRVQSAAVRLLVLRERERMAFRAGSYWDIKASLAKDEVVFEAQLTAVDGIRLAVGKDFDENTGRIPADKQVLLLEEEAAKSLATGLREAAFEVISNEVRQSSRSPYPPFTTSTLQQEANRKLGLTANRTMRIAQRLYESGHITYMRTDSVNLSTQALDAVRALIDTRYGAEYAPASPRQYTTKSKGAQEAHEAIRPAGTGMPTAEELGLASEQAKLYDLIWKRTIASQMSDAKLAFTSAKFKAQSADGRVAEFRASGREVIFPGFFKAYVEGSDDAEEGSDDRSQPLPPLREGDKTQCRGLEPIAHETKPPARFSEASLVKSLEAHGVGRPSTYASIIETIQRRGYVMAKGKQLVPTFIAMAVTQLLEETLTQVVDLQFTAGMEEHLDKIADGHGGTGYLDDFYRKQLLAGVEGGLSVDARRVCTIKAANIEPHEIRVGRYGAFIEYDRPGEEKPGSVSLPIQAAPSDMDCAALDKLISQAKRATAPLGTDPKTGQPVYVLVGPYGPYVQLGESLPHKKTKRKSAKKKAEEEETVETGGKRPKRVSVPQEIDPLAVDFDLALQLLALPRKLGDHPETGKGVRASIGRYGSYVVHNYIYASLKAEDSVLTVDLDRALELLAGKKPRRRGSDPLRELGNHPADGNPVRIMSGPYGAYVKYENVNATIPEGFTVEDVTLEEAMVWIDAKLEAKGRKKAVKKVAAKTAAKDQAADSKSSKKKKVVKESQKKVAKKAKKKVAKKEKPAQKSEKESTKVQKGAAKKPSPAKAKASKKKKVAKK
ncbi:MAG: type I DNA topoisomerase [Myxococcota bacterium]